MRKLFTLLLYCIPLFGIAQIERAEYFIDTDPGTDNGTPITINTPGNTIFESFTINTSSLNKGIHTLYVRTKDANDIWSLYFKQTFLIHDFTDTTTPSQIIAAEYFFDTDPGTNNGTAIAITPSFSVSESLAIPAALSDGIHTLYIRTKDEDDRWSLFFKQTFLVHSFAAPAQTAINQYEYFFDTDPGTGASGNVIDVNPSTFTLNEAIAIPSGGLTEGTHYLYVRARDENGVWSLYEAIEFTITEALSIQDNLLLLTRIFPVPANDNITVDTKTNFTERIKLIDLNGKVIKTFEVDTNLNKIDVSNFAKGTYILQIKTDKGLLNKKIIIN
ncbi:putative secreted protein (Por secretion system target) [Flavobacteriaceae bacterium MAR_2010_72]|nr:putative secreted protein (Por secretion system target) [Flavobacteriaceae bacterium MAR_2010_72]TVZ57576.1 putative secreted protein (Por secretion system target) [Flavobacteriaceae bacterium MAR_2010_105]